MRRLAEVSAFNQETETYGKSPCRSRKKMEATLSLAYQYIDSNEGLETMADRLTAEPTVAVDLEADSMYHFREKVCLIQMASASESFVIDPLRITDFSPLKPLLARPDIQKVFHGADYDIRSLYRDFGMEIHNLLDTELASRFLGITETGLEAVLMNRFHVRLDKKYQKKDWSQRPLPLEMLEYAAHDVLYLVPLAHRLEQELAQKNRLSWVAEECELLSRVRPANNDGAPLFMKFKGAGRMDSRSLAVLENLLQFRKQIAEKKDRPVFKVLGNKTLQAIAVSKPNTPKQLEKVDGLSGTQLGMYGKTIIELIHEALALPETDLPHYPRQPIESLPAALPRRLKALKEWRDKKAEALNIDPSIICNKALMYAITTINPINESALATVEGIKEWQKEAFGKDIIQCLKTLRGKKKKQPTGHENSVQPGLLPKAP